MSKSLSQQAIKSFRANKVALFCLWFIGVICFLAIFADFLAPFGFDEQHIDHLLEGPSLKFWLGTDHLGRDMASRLIYGARMSMAVGLLTALTSLGIGLVYGAFAAWMGGWVDSIMMRVVDMLYSIPTLVLLILVKVIFDSVNLFDHPELRAMTGILVSLSLVGWVTLARVVRGQVLQVKQMLFVEAARSMGSGGFFILARHVIPNILGPIIVLLTFKVPSNILFESFLSFLGLGLQPPYSSWGVLANEGWRSMSTYPHLMIGPGLALFLTMLAFNLFGDGLRDAFDPQMRGRIE